MAEEEFNEWKFSIRRMTKGDIDEVKEIHDLLFPLKYSYSVYLEFISESYLSLILEGKRMVKKTEDDKEELVEEKKIIGVATASREWISLFSCQRSGYLATFGILPGFRKHKLGTVLLNTLTECLRVYFSIKFVDLHMLADNKVAGEFYNKCGYIIIEKLFGFYTFYNKKHDAFLLRKRLDDFKYVKPEGIELSDNVEYLMNNTQQVSWFQRFCLEP